MLVSPRGPTSSAKPSLSPGTKLANPLRLQTKPDAIQKQIEALEFQAATLGMTADKITLLLKLANEGATDAQLTQAAAALKTVAVYKELDAAAKAMVEQQREKSTVRLRLYQTA